MSVEIEDIEKDFCLRLQQLYLSQKPLDLVLTDVDLLEADTVERLTALGGADFLTELRRTVAATKLSLALGRRADPETAAMLYQNSKRLGYGAPALRLEAAALFSRICLRNGHAELALKDLDEALLAVTLLPEERDAMTALMEKLRRNINSP